MTDQALADEELMAEARSWADSVRRSTAPNPWVGAVVVSADGSRRYGGATEPSGGRHAEIVALDEAGDDARGGTLVVTLEPCSHHGRTPPCVDAIVAAGIVRVVVGISDPDANVRGQGIAGLSDAGIDVTVGVDHDEVSEQLAAYIHHRTTGRPMVILKMASTLDGRTAAADGSSRWITGDQARSDVHRLRADSDAVLVGAGTVRSDDPELTARMDPPATRQPLRVVLGSIPPLARVLPAESMAGPLEEVLDELGRRGVLQLLVEGGARVAHSFVSAHLVNRFVLYLAPAVMGGDDGNPVLQGPGASTMSDLTRGRLVSVTRLGDDLRVEVEV